MPTTRILVAGMAAILLAGATALPAAAQAPPQTMSGETLLSLFSKCNADPLTPPSSTAACVTSAAPATVHATCDPNGTSTLTYDISASGPQTQGSVTFEPTAAAGPYPGTFTEQGTVEIGPQSQAPVPVGPGPLDSVLTGTQGYSAGPLTSWTARFRIESGADVVVGTKTLTARVPPNYGACVTRDNEPSPGPLPPAGFPVNGYFSIADASLAYNATIFTPAGVYRDSGTADSDLRETFARAANGSGVTSDVGLLLEIFSSDGTAPTPATKSDCKKGGWQDFGVFKNQGDCVSFFATGGKNPPAG